MNKLSKGLFKIFKNNYFSFQKSIDIKPETENWNKLGLAFDELKQYNKSIEW